MGRTVISSFLFATDLLPSHISLSVQFSSVTPLGLKEQLIFPEVEYDKVEKIRGMDIVFVTTAGTDEEAKELLALMGAPFSK